MLFQVNLHLFVCLHSAKAVISLGGNKTVKFHTFAGGENFSRWLQTHGLVWGEIRRGESSGAGFSSTFICFGGNEGEISINSGTGAARPSWRGPEGSGRGQGGTPRAMAVGWAQGAWWAGSWAHPDLSAPLQCRAGGMLLTHPALPKAARC